MRTIAHVSDLHFGTEDPRLVDALREDLLRARPDLLVVSGDLTQRARRSQFDAARAFLDSLPFPLLAVPGNHDIPLDHPWLRVTMPYRRYERAFGPRQSLWRDEEMIVLGLDTTRSHLWKDGELSLRQVQLIREAFCGAPSDTFRVLVTHHPFLPPRHSPTPTLVGRAEQALAMMEECGAELLLAGHLHLGYHGEVRRHHVKTRRAILAAQAGTAISARTRGEPNAYNLVRLDWPTVEIEVRESVGAAFHARAPEAYAAAPEAWKPLTT
ncbi:MAG TPA: metallophosphoesterase [Candidatus Thermoplasmatota archaeon]|nr:metallophosphoesterase [Candidatus Thermoplasmatota archaeon]